MPLVTVVAGNGAGATCELRVALYRSGCIKQRWTVEQEGGFVRIRGEDVGIVLVGGWDCPSWAPVNPATGTEYFKVARADLQFALERLGGVMCFETAPELAPLNVDEAETLHQRILDARTRLVQAQLELKDLELERLGVPRWGLKSHAEDAIDRVHEQTNGAVAEVGAPPAAQPTTAGALELCVEIGGYEGVTVRVDGIAPADFNAVCQSVRAVFLADVA